VDRLKKARGGSSRTALVAYAGATNPASFKPGGSLENTCSLYTSPGPPALGSCRGDPSTDGSLSAQARCILPTTRRALTHRLTDLSLPQTSDTPQARDQPGGAAGWCSSPHSLSGQGGQVADRDEADRSFMATLKGRSASSEQQAFVLFQGKHPEDSHQLSFSPFPRKRKRSHMMKQAMDAQEIRHAGVPAPLPHRSGETARPRK